MENKFIEKRDKSIKRYDLNKIKNALKLAIKEVDITIEEEKIQEILQEIDKKNFKNNKNTINIEDIQTNIEKTLVEHNLYEIAKAFIIYRERHSVLRKDKSAIIDSIQTISEYVEKKDWRIKANANQGYSIGGLILNISGKVTANYWLNHVYSKKISQAHKNADIHIHDLDMLSGYCAGWSLRNLLNEGFNGVSNKVESSPPKHFSSALMQIVNFFGTLQNEWAGAQAFSSFDTYLAPYIYKDKLNEKQVKQLMQQFIFNLNTPSRWGSQTPFTNLTFDWTVPQDLKDQIPKINNKPLLEKEPTLTYSHFKKEMDMINKAFLEIMVEGDKQGRVFTFPIPTYNITEDFNWEDENTNLLFEVTAKYGIPYFQNFIGSQYKLNDENILVKNEDAYTPGAVRSMCCRLQLDLNELLKRGNGLFGSAEMTGSIGVVTINSARLGFKFRGDKQALFENLEEILEIAKDSLEIKRKIIEQNLENGLYPYTKRYLHSLKNHFSTIGINGINELIINFTQNKENITTKEGIIFAKEILDFMRDKIKQFQNLTGNLYNLEATPAEGTTYRFAKEDKKQFPNIYQSGFDENIYYTNSSQLPVGYTDDPFTALDLQDELQCKYTGGTVMHLYLAEQVSSPKLCKEFIKTVITNYRLPYITISPTFSICPKHGYLSKEHKFCPICDQQLINNTKLYSRIELFPEELRQRCEIWTRVMGYYRPVSEFNLGKQGEFMQRVYFKEPIK